MTPNPTLTAVNYRIAKGLLGLTLAAPDTAFAERALLDFGESRVRLFRLDVAQITLPHFSVSSTNSLLVAQTFPGDDVAGERAVAAERGAGRRATNRGR